MALKRMEVTGWRQPHNEEIYSCTIHQTAYYFGDKRRNQVVDERYKSIIIRKPGRKSHFADLKDSMKLYLKLVRCYTVGRIRQAPDTAQWRTPVNTAQ
jgi:hypothetical protein